MSIYQFNKLDLNDRTEYLWTHGDHVSGVIDDQGRSNFYSLGAFYVEVELSEGSINIASVTAFSKGDRYERMVRSIQLGELPK